MENKINLLDFSICKINFILVIFREGCVKFDSIRVFFKYFVFSNRIFFVFWKIYVDFLDIKEIKIVVLVEWGLGGVFWVLCYFYRVEVF